MTASRVRLFSIALATLTIASALPAPPAVADHLGGIEFSVRTEGLRAHLEWTIRETGGCCAGVMRFATGDGAEGTLDDGFGSTGYLGDASGTGTLSDGRPVAWSRAGPSPVVLRAAFDYHAAGVYNVTWTDCCPSFSGHGHADAGMTLAAAPEGIGSITLTWTAPQSFAPTGYRIDRGASAAELAALTTVPGDASTFTDGGLPADATFVYRVAALGGLEAATPAAAATTPAPPAAPTGLVARAGPADGEIHLAWTAPGDDGGRPVLAYEVYRGTAPDHLHHLATIEAATSLVDTGLPAGVTRHYAISAVNAVGEGPLSNSAYATTFAAAEPPAPLPSGRAATSAAHAGLYTFVLGGRGADGQSLDSILRFDPAANAFADAGGRLPTARHGTSAAWVPAPEGPSIQSCDPMCLRGFVAVAGGATHAGGIAAASTVGDEIVRFDPFDGVVTTSPARLPSPRADTAAAYLDGAVYIVGGEGAGGVPLADVLRYDPVEETVTLAGTLPRGLRGAAAVADGALVYVLGGNDGSADRAEILAFDPQTGAVTDTGARLPSARSYAAAAWTGGAALLFGGATGAGTTDEIVRFTPGGAASLAGRLPAARCCASATFDGAHAYVFGGDSGAAVLDDTVRYAPGAPVNVRAEGGPAAGEARVSWDAPLEAGSSAVTGYRVYRSAPGGVPAFLAATTAKSHVDRTGAPGATYEYRVSAVNDVGEGPLSEPAAATILKALKPNRARNVVAPQFSPGAATITWEAPLPNDGPAPAGYILLRERIDPATGSTRNESWTNVGNVLSYKDAAPVIGVYRWVVIAYNSVGRGLGETSNASIAGPRVAALDGALP